MIVNSGAQILESNITVHSTDYDSYAIISNCDKEIDSDGDIQFSRHSSIWSRTQDFGDDFLDKVNTIQRNY